MVLPVVAAGMIGLTVALPAQAGPEAGTAAAQADLRDQLEAIPGMTVISEEPAPAPGFRFFFLTFRQAVDHRNPQGPTFEQRLQLLHRDASRPMVLHTTGYNMPEVAFRSEPTALVDGNQISVEQRFFEPSRPQPGGLVEAQHLAGGHRPPQDRPGAQADLRRRSGSPPAPARAA